MAFLREIFDLIWKKNIAVYAFTGPSGTGKSFRAKIVGQKFGITTFLDDGLLIVEDEIVAGKSAKREKTYMGAVRVALFDDKVHRDEVARALKKLHLKKILILGTSDKMARKIATRLQLPQPQKFVHIEEVSSQSEIADAARSRLIEGKHVIPVRSFEVKNSYSKIFDEPVHISTEKSKKIYEKSVVRPDFSKKKRKEISHATIARLSLKALFSFDQKIKIKRLFIKPTAQGYKILLTLDFPFGENLAKKILEMKKFAINTIEDKSGILVEDISVILDKLVAE